MMNTRLRQAPLLPLVTALAVIYGASRVFLVHPPLGEVEVYVTDAAATPLDAVPVQLLSPSGAVVDESRTGQFGERGHTSFIAPEGAYQVRVLDPGGAGPAAGVDAPAAVTIRRLEPARIRFAVLPE